MTKRINNQLPYPYNQFFNEVPEPPELNCLEENTISSQCCKNNSSPFFLIIIIFLLFSSNNFLKAASSEDDADDESNIEASNSNYYE